MKFRGLFAVLALALLCGTPLASAMTGSRAQICSSRRLASRVRRHPVRLGRQRCELSFTVGLTIPMATSPHTAATGPGLFPIGTTTVTCNASDAGHASRGDLSRVHRRDPPPPADTPAARRRSLPENPNRRRPCPGGRRQRHRIAVDGVDPPLPFLRRPLDCSYPIGTTTVTCTALRTDSNNSSSGSFTVTVLVDTTDPCFPACRAH